MPIKIFSLKGVPEDEADEVRAVLTNNGIDYYETPPGNWGISMPAIWLADEAQAESAKSLLAQYQRERAAKARIEYAQSKAAGAQRGVVDAIKENPLRFVIYLAAIAAVLYFSTKPFIDLGV